ncbi:putative global transactivator, partial [Lachnellula suecica]
MLGASMIQALRDEGCTLQLYCLWNSATSTENYDHKPRKTTQDGAVSLNIIIYGPELLSCLLEDWLLDNSLFLQDPIHCEKDVAYKNPQLLHMDDGEILTTFSLGSQLQNVDIEQIERRPDLFELLNEEHLLTETEPPPVITTPLYSHQKQALTYMLGREHGVAYHQTGKDVWSKTTDSTGQACIGNISGSLAVSTATLLIVPLPLLSILLKLRRHLTPNSLSWTIFHGASKLPLDQAVNFDIVITTYKVVSLQWSKLHSKRPSLHSVLWHRVVLDEAHIIHNSATTIAKSVCAIQAQHRWAVTGTPIQNRLTDLASLFKFLQVYPYSDTQKFDLEISQPWHRNDRIGCLRIKTLINFVSLYRTKSIIDLPDRHDEVYRLQFSDEESKLYEKVKLQTAEMAADAISSNERGAWRNALSKLNELRLICNHGLMQSKKPLPRSRKGTWTSAKDQSIIEEMVDDGSAFCSLCDTVIAEVTSEDLDA